uniref:hypothetical protein n=1 Tax=uncultured Pontibacter sp. TaxID=453356 RepID=UPI0026237920
LACTGFFLTFALPTRYNGSGKRDSGREPTGAGIDRRKAGKETEKNFCRGLAELKTLLTFAARFSWKLFERILVTQAGEKKEKKFCRVLGDSKTLLTFATRSGTRVSKAETKVPLG